MDTSYKKITSPVGELTLVASNTHLLAVLWEQDKEADRVKIERGLEDNIHPILCAAEVQLNEYFSKQRKEFDLPVQFTGSEFQQKVWNMLQQIPYGKKITYLQIAQQLGDRNATRAVGLANGKNPISIIVPCHRVIGASGKLTGFAGGLENKAFLLDLEQEHRTPTLF